MSERVNALSTAEITKHYFQKRLAAVEAPTAWPIERNNDLTASARHIVREAKKRLGQQSAVTRAGQLAEQDLFRLIRAVEETEGEELSEHERTAAVAAITASLDHYDILTALVENDEINDIIVRAYNDVSVQTNRCNVQTDLRFPDADTYKAFVENLLKRAGKSCTVATPVVDAAVDPHVRACVTHESFSPAGSGPMLTLRIARHRNVSLPALVDSGLAPEVLLRYLACLVSSGAGTLLIAGEVGTGKTTLVKALAHSIPEQEAILVIEDTHELVLKRQFVRTLLTREANTEGAGRISPAMAIRTGMRMAMNRLILGEMRDAEAAEAFIDVCASGHPGISTIHARSARDALARLELFLSRAQANVNIETIRRQIANAVSVVVYLGVDKVTKRRRVLEVSEIGSVSDGAVQISPIFRFHSGSAAEGHGTKWKREAGVSMFAEALREQHIHLPAFGEWVYADELDGSAFDPARLEEGLRQ